MRAAPTLGSEPAALSYTSDVLRRVGEACLDYPRALQIEWLKGRPAAENEMKLRDAAESGQRAEVRVLLAAGTDPDATDGYGAVVTALHLAANRGHEEAVAALAEGGADLDKADGFGGAPLLNAAYRGHTAVVRRLLRLRADCNAVGTGGVYEGKTALELAEEGGQEEAAALLRGRAPTHH